MAYVPNPTDVTQPVESVLAQTAAAEFRALKAYIQSIVAGGGPGAQTPGMVAYFPFSVAPPGFVEAAGLLLVRATFPGLWAAALAEPNTVSDAVWLTGFWGRFSTGDGATTFRIPDLRGVHPRGWDHGRGYDPGRAQGSYQGDSLLDHTHGDFPTIATSAVPGGGIAVPNAGAGLSATTGIVTTSGGAPVNPLEVRVKNVSLLVCLKT